MSILNVLFRLKIIYSIYKFFCPKNMIFFPHSKMGRLRNCFDNTSFFSNSMSYFIDIIFTTFIVKFSPHENKITVYIIACPSFSFIERRIYTNILYHIFYSIPFSFFMESRYFIEPIKKFLIPVFYSQWCINK